MLEWINIILSAVHLALTAIFVCWIKTQLSQQRTEAHLNKLLLQLLTRKLQILEQLIQLRNTQYIPSTQAEYYESSTSIASAHPNQNEYCNTTG